MPIRSRNIPPAEVPRKAMGYFIQDSVAQTAPAASQGRVSRHSFRLLFFSSFSIFFL